MSGNRLISLFVALALGVVVVFTINAGITASEVTSSTNTALDQHERHVDLAAAANTAEQVRLEYRRGEWNSGTAASAVVALDQHERHASLMDAAEYARLEYRRGEWNAGQR
jgi:hypothetical protein